MFQGWNLHRALTPFNARTLRAQGGLGFGTDPTPFADIVNREVPQEELPTPPRQTLADTLRSIYSSTPASDRLRELSESIPAYEDYKPSGWRRLGAALAGAATGAATRNPGAGFEMASRISSAPYSDALSQHAVQFGSARTAADVERQSIQDRMNAVVSGDVSARDFMRIEQGNRQLEFQGEALELERVQSEFQRQLSREQLELARSAHERDAIQYMPNERNGTVMMIDRDNNSVIGEIKVGESLEELRAYERSEYNRRANTQFGYNKDLENLRDRNLDDRERMRQENRIALIGQRFQQAAENPSATEQYRQALIDLWAAGATNPGLLNDKYLRIQDDTGLVVPVEDEGFFWNEEDVRNWQEIQRIFSGSISAAPDNSGGLPDIDVPGSNQGSTGTITDGYGQSYSLTPNGEVDMGGFLLTVEQFRRLYGGG